MIRASLSVEALYERLFAEGIDYFLPQCKLEVVGHTSDRGPAFEFQLINEAEVEVCWLGNRYLVHNDKGTPFTTDQWRMINSIGTVLSGRLQLLLVQGLTPRTFNLFRGLNEDRYVSAFLDPVIYGEALAESTDRVGDAIEVLRARSLTTYEGVRSGTGTLLLGRGTDGNHPKQPVDAVRYSIALTAIRSFHRLCDGIQTVGIIDPAGFLIDIADIREWAEPFADLRLPVPGPTRYEYHAKCTIAGGHVCLILTTNQEIKIFSNGRPALQFLNGRWRLMDTHEKYKKWESAVGNEDLARRLFQAAMNLSEDRSGGLLVVLDDPQVGRQLVAAGGLAADQPPLPAGNSAAKEHLHYLVRARRATELAPTVLESIASIDGAVLLDRTAQVLAFGAILHDPSPCARTSPVEGGRSTAAILASRFGKVLKISEDGPITFYMDESRVWEI